MQHDEAKQKALELDKQLRADDSRFSGSVLLAHQDGSIMFWEYAFCERHDEWWFVFTEHHGNHVYHHEDLERIKEYQHMD